MWKYITRNVRETLERRICSSLTDRSNQDTKQCKLDIKYIPSVTNIVSGDYFAKSDDPKKQNVLEYNNQHTNCGNNNEKEKTQQESWSAGHHVGQSWLNALGWSTALVLSWNLAQPLCKSLSEKKHRCPFGRKPPPFMCWKSKKFHHFRRAHWQFHHPYSLQADADGNWHMKYDSRNFYAYEDGPDGKWGFKYTPTDSKSMQDEVDNKWNETHGVQKSESVSDRESSYASFWRLISNTVFAQPSHIMPKRKESKNQKFEVGGIQLQTYGPPTAEQALEAAAQNLAEAQKTVLGDIDNRVGVELMENGEHHEAVTMFLKAVDMDNAAAAYNLGVCHEMGLGTNQDFKKAAKYYQLASGQGHATAMYNLGVFHVHGWGGLPVDCDRAHELFQRASELGQPDAQKAMGMLEAEKHPPPCINDKYADLFDVDITTSDKDISDMVHNSILKYTEMLQK